MNIRTKISTLWIVLLFNMAFADILGFAYPGALAELMAIGTEGVTFGSAEGVVITPGFLLIAAVFVEIAVLMVYFSRVLDRKANRIANFTAAVLTAVFVIGGGSLKLHYIFFASIEILILMMIVTLAWGWAHDE
ncbi:MAG: hypothetical protein ACI8Z0_003216 [Lentimonas sp.]|jgi:hypothetical protein